MRILFVDVESFLYLLQSILNIKKEIVGVIVVKKQGTKR